VLHYRFFLPLFFVVEDGGLLLFSCILHADTYAPQRFMRLLKPLLVSLRNAIGFRRNLFFFFLPSFFLFCAPIFEWRVFLPIFFTSDCGTFLSFYGLLHILSRQGGRVRIFTFYVSEF